MLIRKLVIAENNIPTVTFYAFNVLTRRGESDIAHHPCHNNKLNKLLFKPLVSSSSPYPHIQIHRKSESLADGLAPPLLFLSDSLQTSQIFTPLQTFQLHPYYIILYLTFSTPFRACIYVSVVACPVAIARTINLKKKTPPPDIAPNCKPRSHRR